MPQEKANIVCTFTFGQTLFWVATVASLFTLSYISASRQIFIVYPIKSLQLKWLKQRATSVCFILIVWPLAAGILLPNFFSYHYDRKTEICTRKWPENFNGQIYGLMTAFFGFVLPMIILVYTFVSIKRSLSRRPSQNTEHLDYKRTTKLLGTLVFAFFVFWGPFFIYWILSTALGPLTFGNGTEGHLQRTRAVRVVVLVGLCNTIANPFIYA